MKFYLSSYKLGNEAEKLKIMTPKGAIGYIPNAKDSLSVDPERKNSREAENMKALEMLGLKVELVDLRDYFYKKEELEKKIKDLGAIFVSGGNTFILRQAMKLSGLDEILKEIKNTDVDFLYSGYSAGGCVLAPSFENYSVVDDPNDMPYKELQETIWEGLGLVDFAFMPHYKSDHEESGDIDKEIALCEENNIAYKAIRDGEVIIIDK